MKNSAIIFFILILIVFSIVGFAQKPKTAKPAKSAAKTNLVKPEKIGDENAEFEFAATTPDVPERIAALRKFMANFPQSEKKIEALELIVVARAENGDEKLRANDAVGGTEMFRLAVKDAPVPFSDKLYTEVIVRFPINLFWRGQQKAALEIAQMIEAKIDGNAAQTLGLATFYLGIENAAEAERLARKAIALDARLPAAYQTLGLAHRINFQLDEAASAYRKALEIDPSSSVAKRSLAEMQRAAGKADEAVALYREVLAADPADAAAQTGLILALFDSGKASEAEPELRKSLAAIPNNLPLLVGAAYWYAANGDGAKAVELATKAVEIEPRYTWAHIALARGLTRQKRPLEAERTLTAARQYGNFPTLDYEIASARFQAGFFREAAETMRQNFTIKNGAVETRLGGRVAKESDNFIELLADERRASIFQPVAADDRETAEKLKALLILVQKLDAPETDETEIGSAADRFVEGEDAMSLHRRLYVAERLLQTGKALPKTLEIAQSALGKTDAALDVASPAAAVLADELYESRRLAANRNQLIVVPEVPRQTLSAILRGRIEEIAGWTLYRQDNPAQAVVRLKRAVSVLPDGSAWWRSSMWRLGAALQADGKDKEALDAYLRSYPKDAFDSARYGIIEALYQKVNGSVEGLDARISATNAAAPPLFVAAAVNIGAETTSRNDVKNEVKEAAREELKTEAATPRISSKPLKVPDNVPLVAATASQPAAATAQVETPPTQPPAEIAKEAARENIVGAEKKDNVAETKEKAVDEPLETELKIETPKEVSSNVSKNFNQTPNPLVSAAKSAAQEKTPSETPPTTVTESPTKQTSAPEIKTEIAPQENAPKITEEPKENSAGAKTAAPKINSLFEPIVISVPQRGQTANPKSEANESNETGAANPSETEKKVAPAAPVDESAKPKSAAQTESIAGNTSVSRPRVVITDNLPPEKIAPCAVYVNEENISLLNGGGVLGVLVGMNKNGDLKQLTAVSSSPDDVQVIFEPEIIAPVGQAFYVVKSVSSKTGVFTVTFAAPCGKKEVSVKVR